MKLLQTSSAAELSPPSCKDGRESLGEEEPPPPPALLRCELRAGFVGWRAEVPSRRWGKGMRWATLTSISPPDVSKSYTIVLVSIFSHIHPPPGLGALCSGPPNPGGRGEAGCGRRNHALRKFCKERLLMGRAPKNSLNSFGIDEKSHLPKSLMGQGLQGSPPLGPGGSA